MSAQAKKKLTLTSPRKMPKGKRAPANTAVDLKQTLQAAVEHAAPQAPAVTGLDGDAAIDAASIGELVKAVDAPARGLRQIQVTGADGKVRTAKASRSQSRRPARAVEPAPKAEKERTRKQEIAARAASIARETGVDKGTAKIQAEQWMEIDAAVTGEPQHKTDHSETLASLLSRPEGATAAELMKATNLSRGGVNAAVSRLIKSRGLKLTTQRNPATDPADRRNTAFLYFAA